MDASTDEMPQGLGGSQRGLIDRHHAMEQQLPGLGIEADMGALHQDGLQIEGERHGQEMAIASRVDFFQGSIEMPASIVIGNPKQATDAFRRMYDSLSLGIENERITEAGSPA